MDGMPSFGVPPTLALHSLPEPTGYKELSTSERNVTLVNATFVILARNSDIWGILQSMRDLEGTCLYPSRVAVVEELTPSQSEWIQYANFVVSMHVFM